MRRFIFCKISIFLSSIFKETLPPIPPKRKSPGFPSAYFYVNVWISHKKTLDLSTNCNRNRTNVLTGMHCIWLRIKSDSPSVYCISSACSKEKVIYDVQKRTTVAFQITATSIFTTDILHQFPSKWRFCS